MKTPQNSFISPEYKEFLEALKKQVATRRYQAIRSANRELILLYHHIGTEILVRQKKYGWGAKVIERLSKDLRSEFPEMKGFSVRNLLYMKLFADTSPDSEFVQQVAAHLPWFHIVILNSFHWMIFVREWCINPKRGAHE